MRTLADVAAHAGVSLATASRVLNKSPDVSHETRIRVLDAIELLGYRADLRARSLATGRNHAIGLLLGDLGAPDDLALARAVLDAAADADQRVYVAEGRGDHGRRRDTVARWDVDVVDAIILLPDREARDQEELIGPLSDFTGRGGRVVHVDTRDRELPGSVLVLEEHDAAADLGEALARSGHLRFGMVARTDEDLAGDRAQGFVAGVRRVHGDNASVCAYVRGTDGFRSQNEEPQPSSSPGALDCVFALDVECATTDVIAGLRDRGVPVGADASLASFSYADQSLPATRAVAVMPSGLVAARALQLAAADGTAAMRVAGTCHLGATVA